VRAFQTARGLRVDAVCGPQTWGALVEAGYRLGDRLLYVRTPMQRGDDVAELQRRLSALGFDPGRIDAIFGPDTRRALEEFQRNAGLPPDGICGPATLRELERLSARADVDHPVSSVRERLTLNPRSLPELRVVVGDLGGAATLAAATARSLRELGAAVVVLGDADESVQAAVANSHGADAYVGLLLTSGRGVVTYYASAGFVSAGGHALACRLCSALEEVPGLTIDPPTGMRLTVLRETRMPAVLCELGPSDVVVPASARVARQVTRAVEAWAAAPVDP